MDGELNLTLHRSSRKVCFLDDGEIWFDRTSHPDQFDYAVIKTVPGAHFCYAYDSQNHQWAQTEWWLLWHLPEKRCLSLGSHIWPQCAPPDKIVNRPWEKA